MKHHKGEMSFITFTKETSNQHQTYASTDVQDIVRTSWSTLCIFRVYSEYNDFAHSIRMWTHIQAQRVKLFPFSMTCT